MIACESPGWVPRSRPESWRPKNNRARSETIASPAQATVENGGKLMIISYFEGIWPDTLAAPSATQTSRAERTRAAFAGKSRGCIFEILESRCQFIKMIHKSFRQLSRSEAKLIQSIARCPYGSAHSREILQPTLFYEVMKAGNEVTSSYFNN
jgi:hypothetical protein